MPIAKLNDDSEGDTESQSENDLDRVCNFVMFFSAHCTANTYPVLSKNIFILAGESVGSSRTWSYCKL